MELQELVNLMMNSGITIIILAYFIWRDQKFMQKLDSTLEIIKEKISEQEKEK